MSEHESQHGHGHAQGVSKNEFYTGLAAVLVVMIIGFAFVYSQGGGSPAASQSAELASLSAKVSALEAKLASNPSTGATAAPQKQDVEMLLYFDSSNPISAQVAAKVPAFNANLKQQNAGIQFKAVDMAGKTSQLVAAGFASLPSVFLSDEEAAKNQQIKDSFSNAPRVSGGYGIDATLLGLANAKTLIGALSCGKTGVARLSEYSDFQCPYCARIAPAITGIREKFKAELEFEFKHFPLPFHENAQNASEASLCAAEQGAFDEYHDKLFENQQALSPADLKKYARDLKLDAAKFDKCFESHAKKAIVEADIKEGTETYGIGGTPTFVLDCNTVFGAGAQADLEAQVCTAHPELAACKA